MSSGYVGIDKDYFVSVKEVLNITAETGALETQDRVRELPPADVVEVVRCKDCKWSEVKPYGCEKYLICDSQDIWCTLEGDTEGIDEIEVEENHYCSYGERKDGEGNE